MARNYLQGKFTPKNPDKYIGDVNDIVYRSGWELTAFKYCDNENAVVKWGSEEIVIPYISPKDGRAHRYFMDLVVVTKRNDGSYKTTLIEIKPKSQISEPKKTGRKKTKTFLNEVATYLVNTAKWKAAKEYCNKRGWEFIFWTEDHLVPGNQKPKN